MRQKVAVLGLALLAGLFAACSDGMPDSEKGDVSGQFRYTGYDRQGTVVIRGTLDLNEDSGGLVNGRWNLQAVGNPDRLGPQVGQGDAQGNVTTSSGGAAELVLNLNPGWADNNVFVYGQVRGSRIEGDWQWSTLLGSVQSGTFVAERN